MTSKHLEAARAALRGVSTAAAKSRMGGGSGESGGVEALAKAVDEIIKHLEAQSGPDDALPPITGEGNPGGSPEENDLDVSGEPRQFD